MKTTTLRPARPRCAAAVTRMRRTSTRCVLRVPEGAKSDLCWRHQDKVARGRTVIRWEEL